MPDPIRIALDESVPTTKGWYLWDHAGEPKLVYVHLVNGKPMTYSYGLECPCTGGRWSRRIEIGGA